MKASDKFGKDQTHLSISNMEIFFLSYKTPWNAWVAQWLSACL